MLLDSVGLIFLVSLSLMDMNCEPVRDYLFPCDDEPFCDTPLALALIVLRFCLNCRKLDTAPLPLPPLTLSFLGSLSRGRTILGALELRTAEEKALDEMSLLASETHVRYCREFRFY